MYNEGTVFSFFRGHPFLLISLGTLYCSLVGYLYEFVLLRRFGVNITQFAELDDFLLAGIGNPSILLWSLPIFVLGASGLSFKLHMYRFRVLGLRAEEQEVIALTKSIEEMKTAEKENLKAICDAEARLHLREPREFPLEISQQLNRILTVSAWYCLLGAFATYLLVVVKVSDRVDAILDNQGNLSSIQLQAKPESDIEMSGAIFVSATTKFMFFFQLQEDCAGQTIIIPSNSIASVRLSGVQPIRHEGEEVES